jgi:PilZ domain
VWRKIAVNILRAGDDRRGIEMGERRISRRSKSFLRGFVYVSRKRGALSCLVRDLSEKGARIIFSDEVTLPDMVELYIPQREQTLRARVTWRKNDEIGLAFTEIEQAPETASPTAGEIVQRVALLEAEIASLRAVLKRLKGEKAEADEAAA